MSSSLDSLIPTEQINPRTVDIDLLPTEDMLSRINQEDALVAAAVGKAVPQIAVVVDKIAEALLNDGHLFYFGAGTSGRLGVLDAAECPPTYGTPPHMVQAFIAGGEPALRSAIEGAEDSEADGRQDFLSANAKPGDVVVGISASGGAPYILGAVREASKAGCFTAGLTCNPRAPLVQEVHQAIVVEVGPEVIAGSTRMKAGTAQKLVLNMLTTGAMIKVGKTYENWMVDVQPTNQKLRERAVRMVGFLAKASPEEARRALDKTGFQVKPAVLMLARGLTLPEARACLEETGGKLRLALNPGLV